MTKILKRSNNLYYTYYNTCECFNVVCSRHREMQRKRPAGENPHSIHTETGVAKQQESLFNRESQVESKKLTLLRQGRKSPHSHRNRQTETRRAKAELVVGDRRLRKLPGFRQGWQQEISPVSSAGESCI